MNSALSSPNALFERYIGIDYSGAQTPESSLKGLRVYRAERTSAPQEIPPPSGSRKYWSRRGIAEWLTRQLSDGVPSLVGIDHGFSFPLAYFETYQLAADWPAFLDDFQTHWPTDGHNSRVQDIRNGSSGAGEARLGSARWRRVTEQRVGAKSVFHFDVPGSVAKSTHAGLPWLRYLRQQLAGRLHAWPFDGWAIPTGQSAVAEIYPSLWSKRWPQEGRTDDQHDAYVACAWMQQTDRDGGLEDYLKPPIPRHEASVAQIEGWILGVGE